MSRPYLCQVCGKELASSRHRYCSSECQMTGREPPPRGDAWRMAVSGSIEQLRRAAHAL